MAGYRRKVFSYLTAFFLCVATLSGQRVGQLSDQALNVQITELVEQNDFLRARPYLWEMKKRMEKQGNKEVLEPVDFFLASSYLQEYQESSGDNNKQALRTAVRQFEEYVKKHPSGPRKTVALLNLGDAYSDLEQYDKAISSYTKIYNDSNASGSVRNEIRGLIAKTYLKTDQPQAGLRYYKEAYDQAILNEGARAEAATWLLQAYLAKGEIEAIKPYFDDLTGQNSALFNPKFNVTLIKAGDQLFEDGNYDFAILFYAIVKKKDDIVAFYEKTVQQLKTALGYQAKDSESAILVEKRLREAEANLKAVEGIRDYDADVRWRSARVLLESERTWEALWSFYNLMLDYPKHEQAEEFLFLAFTQARDVEDGVMIVSLGKDYLSRSQYKKYRGQITIDLATYYQEQGQHQKFYDLATSYLDGEPENDGAAAQISSLLAIHLIERERYKELLQRMERYNSVLANLKATKEATKYWSSLALLLLVDYVRALESFNQFIDEYGENSKFSEDAYYRRAISVYGAEGGDAAYDDFADFVERYPNSNRRGEAELYLGDIMRQRGEADTALGHYQRVEDFTNNLSFITKATFAISEVLEAKGEGKKAVRTLKDYIERYGQDAELGKAYRRLGRFEQRQGNIAERFRYDSLGLEATAKDPKRYAADQILLEYVEDYPTYIKNYEAAIVLIEAMLDDPQYRESIMQDRTAQYQFFESEEGKQVDPKLIQKIVRDRNFRENMQATPEKILNGLRSNYSDNLKKLRPYRPERIFSKLLSNASEPKTVLELRIAMGRDKLSGTEAPFPFTDEQVANASPAVMLWRAEKLREHNPAKANELLQTSLQKHPYAPNRYETMLTIAEISKDQASRDPSEDKWLAALANYNSIIERFGMGVEDGAPFIAKGQILIELEREEDALSVLSNVVRNREWRGEPQAKAHLYLGVAHYEMQSYSKAHGFFERLMLGFAGFDKQIAKAYYWDLRTLEAMNESESVNQLLDEVRTRDDLKETEGYRLIEENYAL